MPDKLPPLHKQKKLFIFDRVKYTNCTPSLYAPRNLPFLAELLRPAR
ncbi:MAG: hypothetical protein NTW90_00350 [Nitrosospira sp.]|nr:hypothetical protein [Nitrosospira sp.]